MSKIESLETLLHEQLKDIYSAEKQLTKALPRMAKSASSDVLKEALEAHLKETEVQIERLEKIAEEQDIKLSGKKCRGMEGLIDEGKEALDLKGDEVLIDAAIIAAAQKVEHYEISAYGTARTIAEQLGLSDVAELLTASLEEESAADEKLTSISEEDVLGEYLKGRSEMRADEAPGVRG
ncbi:MAG: ferritin-like domain-containing protein [Deltaproteobacteria bacterium]|nr:ferritin-like domain-containing protein [Deltaproteobacteria bacterium]